MAVDSGGNSDSPPTSSTGGYGAPEMSVESQVAYAWNVHGYVHEYVRHADAKAGVVIAWSSAMLGVLISLDAMDVFRAPLSFCHASLKATVMGLCAVIGFVGLLIAFLCAVRAVWPTTGGSESKTAIVYWKDILDRERDGGYRSALTGRSDGELLDELCAHLVTSSRISARKYFWIGRAIQAACIGSIFAAIQIAILKVWP